MAGCTKKQEKNSCLSKPLAAENFWPSPPPLVGPTRLPCFPARIWNGSYHTTPAMCAPFHQTLKDLEKEVTHYLYLLHSLHCVNAKNVLLDGQEELCLGVI